MDSKEIRNCPFCGSEGIDKGDDEISCSNQECPMYWYDMESDKWNKRTEDQKLHKALEDIIVDLKESMLTKNKYDMIVKISSIVKQLEALNGKEV